MNKILLLDENIIYTSDALDFSSNDMTFTDILGVVHEIRGSQIVSITPTSINPVVIRWIKSH
jgi:hypothetical protein